MPKLLFQQHGSFRLTADDGRVIYCDPYAGTDESYSLPADLILITHGHKDHNQIDRCTQKPDCVVITNAEALTNGKHNSFNIDGITIHAAVASNEKHDPMECVGYILTVNNVKLYIAGDTSKTKQMERFADLEIDYAFLPGDGVFNMDLREAAECTRLIQAKHNIIYHLHPQDPFREKAEAWIAPNKLILEPGQEIEIYEQ